jgi:hypothetical protein
LGFLIGAERRFHPLGEEVWIGLPQPQSKGHAARIEKRQEDLCLRPRQGARWKKQQQAQ